MKLLSHNKGLFLLSLVVVMILSVAFVASCAPAAEEEVPAPSEEEKPEAEAPEEAERPEVEAELEDTLNVLSWGYYIDFAIQPFEEKYGVKVNVEYFDNIPDQINKLKAVGPGRYDVSFVGVENYKKFFDLDLIGPLDPALLESWPNIYGRLREMVLEWGKGTVPEGSICAIPYAWGTTGIIYNTEKITEEIDSWAALWDEKYAGRIAILDSVEEDQRMTALYLGLDINDFSDQALAKIEQAWREQKPLIKTYWSTGEDLIQFLTTEEVWIADGWDGQARNMQTEGYPVAYVIPKEGAVAWIDGPFLVKGAPHPNLAHKFIDWLTSPEIQLEMTKEIMYSPSNSKVREMVDEETAKFLAIDKEENIERLLVQKPWDVETTQKVTELWNEVKG